MYTTGQRNVSGGLAWYRAWAKHRCNLKQEDKYPNHCDFKKNEVIQAELDKRYPDLAEMKKKIAASRKRIEDILVAAPGSE